MRRGLVVWGVACLMLMVACREPAPPAQPLQAAPVTPVAPGTSTPAAPPSAAASGVGAASTTCEPWSGRGFKLVAREQAGHGAFFRELTYDDATGMLAVHDSDPYATGKEQMPPRVLQKAMTLSSADREAVAKDLLAICPDAAAKKARCAPGGCARIDVQTARGVKSVIEDHTTVGNVMSRLSTFFADLRKSQL